MINKVLDNAVFTCGAGEGLARGLAVFTWEYGMVFFSFGWLVFILGWIGRLEDVFTSVRGN